MSTFVPRCLYTALVLRWPQPPRQLWLNHRAPPHLPYPFKRGARTSQGRAGTILEGRDRDGSFLQAAEQCREVLHWHRWPAHRELGTPFTERGHGAASCTQHCGAERFLLLHRCSSSPQRCTWAVQLVCCTVLMRGHRGKNHPQSPVELLQVAVSPLGTAAGDSDLGMAEKGKFHPPPHWLFQPRSLDLLQGTVLTRGGTARCCTASAALAFWFRGYRNGWRQLSRRKVSCTPQIGSGCLPRRRGEGERQEEPEVGAEPGCRYEPHSSAPAWAMCHCTHQP